MNPDLTLEWKRLVDIPIHDNNILSYTVVINSTKISDITFVNVTTKTSLSINFLEEILTAQGSECVEFEIFVSGMNKAGVGAPARITETLPICERI